MRTCNLICGDLIWDRHENMGNTPKLNNIWKVCLKCMVKCHSQWCRLPLGTQEIATLEDGNLAALQAGARKSLDLL